MRSPLLPVVQLCSLTATSWPKPPPKPMVAMQAELPHEIEFVIHPDGTVDTTVKGLKGDDCLKVTREIENALGEVVERKSTSEMYENNVQVDNEQFQTVSNEENDDQIPDW